MPSRWEPFAEIAWHRPATSANDARWFEPATDIVEEEEAFLVRIELPGLRPEDVKVDLDEHVMSVHGERKREGGAGNVAYHRCERAYGVFARSFTIPDSADGRDAVAVMSEGVLTVRIPKRAPESLSPPSLPPLERAS